MIDTIAVLTGASRGLGAALARGLLRPGVKLVTLARNDDADLAAQAKAAGAELEQIKVDLSDLAAVDAAGLRIAGLLKAGARRYVLINNAGTVHPVAASPAMTDGPAIAQAFNLNVTAVMLLTARFVQAVGGLDAQRRVINISSGAGRNPTAGWGVYCATKSALDMYTRVFNQEQGAAGLGAAGVRAVSLAPGIVDTDMQATIRSSDPAHFPALSKFRDFKQSGALAKPEAVAARILAYLDRDDFGATEIDDIRNYQ